MSKTSVKCWRKLMGWAACFIRFARAIHLIMMVRYMRAWGKEQDKEDSE